MRRVTIGLKRAGESGEWLSYGLNQAETRYSTLAQINTANVKQLGLSWSYDMASGGGGQEATPLFSNGTLYGITNWSVVFAVDARTGQQKWRWDPEVNQATVRSKICCGVVNRGPAIYQGLIMRPGHRRPAAGLDAETGKVILGSARGAPPGPLHLTMAPRIPEAR